MSGVPGCCIEKRENSAAVKCAVELGGWPGSESAWAGSEKKETRTSVDGTGGRLLTAPGKRAQGEETKIGGAVTHLPGFFAARQRASVRFLGDFVFRVFVFGVIQ